MWSKKELIDKQAAFWVLIANGSTLQAACDAVGVDRRSGRHWRQATGGMVPRTKSPLRRAATSSWRTGWRSPICTWPGPGCDRSPRSWVGRPLR